MRLFYKERDGQKRIVHILGMRFTYTRPSSAAPAAQPHATQESFTNPLLAPSIELKNTAAKKRCFTLATGPSIKEQDLTKLAGEDCFSISNFFLHKDIGVIKPKLHFFAPYHEPLILSNFIDWLKMADRMLPPGTNIVLGISDYDKVQENNLFPNRKIYFLQFDGIDVISTDILRPVKAPQTGPIMILPVLDYMGYEEIYLVGQDMNRMANYMGTTANFYDKDPRQNATDGAGWADIITELKRTCKMFEQFKAYQDFFESKGKKLYNLSPSSWLSFVEKKDFNEVLKK